MGSSVVPDPECGRARAPRVISRVVRDLVPVMRRCRRVRVAPEDAGLMPDSVGHLYLLYAYAIYLSDAHPTDRGRRPHVPASSYPAGPLRARRVGGRLRSA